ncbi:major facilitator transporter [Amycolatopsis mediterranei S699]|uniref:Major facilitator transporter n=2 Tax=Amycolatopsis mediterranei TaxID=33910 RepID=A0A0H3D9S6_AMYMU|nr:MFS transporter [Amycolatopsis mediterranei]ADJ47401.1 major facilitator transporter [Amycolatopsis mediterranei U32]AEK44247.1 major facilitator transporter [Amycolatopsis mediterranei S699]AFO79112.1 major facilitator transporter [Amycolatopsis mediterranei S699]AGT86240.1 major facilitator transporter [Amycolatopsis mediterranei RB]KDO12411.1 MFS transporter [Amycolatopsis mediterranei]
MDLRRVLIGLMSAMFTVLISANIVANALPAISTSLRGTPTEYTWVVVAALLTNAVSTPIWGKLSDLYSKKLLVQVTILLFVIGTVAGALAPAMGVLIAGRAVQGLAIGGVFALVQSILASIIPARQRGRYAGYVGGVMALATSIGPLAGGFIVDSPLGWRWCFWACLPLAALALVLLRSAPPLRTEQRHVTIDWVGIGLLTSGMSVLLIWVSFAGKAGFYGWVSPVTALLVGIGLLCLTAFVVVENRAEQPIIPLAILRQRTTVLAVLGSVAVGFSLFGAIPLLSQYLQVARNIPATAAGLLLLPLVVGSFVSSLVSGRLISRDGRWKRYLVAGAIALTAGLAAAGFVDHTSSLWFFGAMAAMVGIGTGMLTQNIPLVVANTVDVRDVGAATSTVQFFRALAGAVTLAVFGSILNSLTAQRIHDGAAVSVAYGDSVGPIFLIAAALGVLALSFLRHQELRQTIHADGTRPAEALARR